MSGLKSKRRVALSAAVAAALGGTYPALAGNFFWEGDNGTTWNINTGLFGSNWSSQLAINNDPLTLPGVADDVFFYAPGATSGPLNTTLGQDFSIRSLTLLAGNDQPLTIDGGGANTLTLGSGGLSIFGGLVTNQINAAIVLGANQTWANNGTNTLIVSGVVSGTGTLSTSGPGTINFTNANTFAGGLVLSTAGNVVTLTGANGSAQGLSSLQLNGGAVLSLDSTAANHATQDRIADNLTVNSGGGIFNLVGNASTPTTETVGTLNLRSGASQINVTGAPGSTLTFGSATIPSLSRTVGGTVNFNPAANTAVNLPNVAIVNGIIGAHATIGSVDGSGSAVDWATVDGSGNVVAYNNYATQLGVNSTDNVKLNSAVTLNPGTTVVNSLYLTDQASISYTGGSTSADLLVIGSGGIIANGVTTNAPVNGNFQHTNTAIIGRQDADTTVAGQKSTAGFITAANGELIVTAANGSGVRIASVIQDFGTTSVNLTISGNGIVDLGAGNAQQGKAVNTFTGITTVNDNATLVVNQDQQFGATNTAFRPNAITLNGGTLLTTAGFSFATNRGITVGAQGGTLRYIGGSTWTLTTAITGQGGLTFSALPTSTSGGGDTVVINEGAGVNSYQGATTFEVAKNPNSANVGTIRLGQNNVLPSNTALTINAIDGQGIIDFNGKSLTVGSLAGNGRINNHNSVLTVGQNGLSTEFSGFINGTGSVVKVGSGVQTFSGSNTYGGPTTINGGTLLVTGQPTSTGLITVNSGGALGGNGAIAAPVVVNGALAPALNANTVASLTINNNLTLTNGASLNYLFGAPGINDSVTVGGSNHTLLLLGGPGSDVLNINDMAGFGVGSYTLLQTTGGAVFTDNTSFVINGNSAFNYALSFTNGANGSLVLTVTPGNPTVAWSGATNGSWDTTTVNWTGGNGIWANGDNAVFDNSGAARPNVTVAAAGVQPNSILFNNGTVNYSFDGGPITSTGNFTKNQAGAVTFNNNVSVGVAKINSGSVTVGAAGTFSSPSLIVAQGASLNVNGSLGSGTVLESDGATTFTGTSQALAGLSGGAGGVVNLNGPTELRVGGGVFAGTIAGPGSSLIRDFDGPPLVLSGTNTYTGTTTIINGQIVAVGSVTPGVDGPLGNSSAVIPVGDTSGSQSAGLLLGGPSTITRDIVVQAGNTGTPSIGGASGDVQTFANTVTLANTNSATLLVADAAGTVSYTGSLTGPGAVNVVGPGTSVFNGNTASYTGSTTISGGTLSVPGALTNSASVTVAGGTLAVTGTVAAPSVNVHGGTLNLNSGGTVQSPAPMTVDTAGNLNVATNSTLLVPSLTISNPGSVNSQVTFAQGAGYTNTINVIGAGFVNIQATDTARVNLVSGPINLTGGGGVRIRTSPQASGDALVNTYSGQINVSGNFGTNGADGILQITNPGTNTVPGVGIFTNVHLADGASINFGLGPGEATPRPHIVVDLSIDGTSALISTNADGSSPNFVRNITATNAGTVVNVFANSGTNLFNSNAPLGAKSVNFVGALSPNLKVVNSEAPAAGINLTSETNIASAFSLNGGTFETGTFNGGVGTTNLQADANPGTSGTFLVTAGTFNANRSADATITYNGGTLNINAAQTLVGFNVNNDFTAPGGSLVQIGSLSVGAGKNLVLDGNNTVVGSTGNNGTITYASGGTVSLGDVTGGTGALVVGGGGDANVTAASFAQDSITINDGASLTVPVRNPRITNTVNTLTINGNGLLDLGNHALLVDNTATPEATVRQYLHNAYNADPSTGIGDWNGKGGITSADAIAAHNGPNANFKISIGYVNGAYATDPLINGPIPGQESLPTNRILVRPALYGDLNLDGKVDDTDLAILSGLGQYNQPTDKFGWLGGDLNHDGKVDDIDLQILSGAGNYNGPSYGAVAAGARAAAATPSLTAANGGVAGTTQAVAGDGVLDFVYDPATGDLKIRYDGDPRVTAAQPFQVVRFKSAGGHFIPANFNQTDFGAGVTATTTALNGTASGSNSVPDGYDLGNVLPAGLTIADLTTDLTLQWNVFGGGLTLKSAGIDIVPEPTMLGLIGLGGAGLLARRRRRRQV